MVLLYYEKNQSGFTFFKTELKLKILKNKHLIFKSKSGFTLLRKDQSGFTFFHGNLK